MDIKTIGIIGAGQMGTGIAQVCAVAGISVLVHDRSEQAVAKLIGSVGVALTRMAGKGKITDEHARRALSLIASTTALAGLRQADLVIEAVSEDFDIKAAVLAAAAAVVAPNCILASNTSSVSITRLACGVAHAERVIGMHFFNPVPLMGLVEVIPALQTGAEVVAGVRALAGRLAKTPIVVANAPGFAVNRLLIPMINEAVFLLQEGIAEAEAIDQAMTLGAAHPMGPLALADLIGLDTCLAIMTVLQRDLGEAKYRPARLLRDMVHAGRLGRKSGRGFFTYAP